MKAFRNFLLGALVAVALMVMLRSFLCQYFCPQESCHIPNPTIEFNVEGGNFGVTAHAVPGADAVTIDVFGHDGTLATSVSPAINSPQIILVPEAQRPLQLVFTYKSLANVIVSRDSIMVDDRQNGGTPIVDVVIGVHQGSQQSCPSMPNNVNVTTITSTRSKFSWTPGKIYKITLDHGNPDVDYILKTEYNGVTGCYKAVLWRQDEYSCLTTQPGMTQIDATTVEVTTSAGTAKVTGMDNCDGQTPREIFIKFDTAPSNPPTVVSN